MIQAVFMEEDARSALKRVPWGKLTAVFAVAIVVAWVSVTWLECSSDLVSEDSGN